MLLSRRRLFGAVPALVAAGGAVSVAVSGCGVLPEQPARSQAPVTLNVLLDPNLITLFGETAPVIPTFQEANPNVKLSIEAGPPPADGAEARYSKFRAKLAAGDVVDVFGLVPSDAVPGFGKQAQVRDLGPLLAKQRAVAAKDYWPAVMGAVTYQGKLFALPYQVFTQLVYYNEDLLKREGQPLPTRDWTWDKLLEVAKAITRQGSEGRPGQWGINMVLGNFRAAGVVLMWAYGGKLFDDDANPRSLSLDPAGAEGLQWLGDMYAKHRVVVQMADATAGGFTNTSQMVTAGQVGFNYSSLTWRGYRNNTGFKADVQMLPKGKARQTASTWGDCLTLPTVSKNPDQALALMTHISGPAGQKLMIPVVDQFPSVESIATSPEWLKFDQFNRQAAVDMIRLAKPIPPTPAWVDINSQALGPLLSDVLAGRKTALDGLREVKPKVDDLLRTLG
jgi:multiple sugar transport system substrate-binding protein